MPGPVQGMIPELPRTDEIRRQSEAAQPTGESSNFFQTLRGAMSEVQQLQADGQQKIAELLSGNGEDLHQTMIAVEKADLAFELMMQVRNKIVQAYQEISRMSF